MAVKLVRQERTQVVYRGLTQAAKALGVSRPHLSYVLHGKRRCGARLAARLRRMGIDVTAAAGAAAE